MPSPKQAAISVLQLALTLILLGLLFHFVGWQSLRVALSEARLPWLAANYGVTLLIFSLMAGVQRLLLAKAELQIALRRVVMANTLSSFHALVVPGDVVAGVSKWSILSAATGERTKVLSAMVLNKLVLVIPSLIFGSVAFAFENPFPDMPVVRVATVLALAAAGGLVLMLHPWTGAAFARYLHSFSRPVRFLHRPIRKLLESLEAFRSMDRYDHVRLLTSSLVVYALSILGFSCVTRSLGFELPIPTLAWIQLALFVSRLLPITFSNLGVREGLLLLALADSEVASANVVGAGLVMFSNSLLIGLIGAGWQLAIAFGWTNSEDSRPAGA